MLGRGRIRISGKALIPLHSSASFWRCDSVIICRLTTSIYAAGSYRIWLTLPAWLLAPRPELRQASRTTVFPRRRTPSLSWLTGSRSKVQAIAVQAFIQQAGQHRSRQVSILLNTGITWQKRSVKRSRTVLLATNLVYYRVISMSTKLIEGTTSLSTIQGRRGTILFSELHLFSLLKIFAFDAAVYWCAFYI